MKNILCFGDSNTYGFNPENGSRYDTESRWTSILKQILNENVIEAGFNNRTSFSDNPCGIEQTGYKSLPKYLKKELDIVILSIGINDLQSQYQNNLEDYYLGIEKLIKLIKENNEKTKIILASPSHINDNILKSYFATLFDEKSIKKSKQLSQIYEKVAKNNGCFFLDLEQIAKTSEIDGLHYAKDEHKKLATIIKKIF